MSMKTIVCYGDSNTWGYVPKETESGLFPERYGYDVRWPGVLQKLLGSDFRVIEEGLSGRTTAFDDPLDTTLNGLSYLDCCMRTNMPIDVVILMLGTNDTKEYLGKPAQIITAGLELLISKIKTGGYGTCEADPEILVVAPAALSENIYSAWTSVYFGAGCLEKSKELGALYEQTAKLHDCLFVDAQSAGVESSTLDAVHLDAGAHKKLADVIFRAVKAMPVCSK